MTRNYLLGIGLLTLGAFGCATEIDVVTTSKPPKGGAGGGAAVASVVVATSVASVASSASASTGAGGMMDGAGGHPSEMYPADFPKPPQVEFYGGPVLKSPQVYPVFFAGDDAEFTGKAADFVSKVGATKYWAAATSEYGVGPATGHAPITLKESPAAQIDDSDIQSWLAGKLNADDPAFPKADDNTLVVIFYPGGTSITLQGETSCQTFGGYHNGIQLDDKHNNQGVAYAVIPRCNYGSLIDTATGTTSHEMIEAATDPQPESTPAYAMIDERHLYWMRLLGGGEVGDMCAQFPGSFVKFAELPDYIVQRSWSNAAAKAGHDPCVPELPGEVYFAAAPVLPDTVTQSFGGQNFVEEAVRIPLGAEKQIDLDLFSEADTGGPWTVQAKDLAAMFGGTKRLELTLLENTGVNGQKLHLKIKVLQASQYKSESFVIVSEKDGAQHMWLGLVAQ